MAFVVIRLRDVTQETEQDQRRRMAEMEKDVMNVEELEGACGEHGEQTVD